MSREMKDSGIEWIGKIPENWDVTLIKRLFIAKAGGDAKPECYSDFPDSTHMFPVYTNASCKEQIYAYTESPRFSGNAITVTGRGDIGNAFYRETPFDAIIRLIVLTPKRYVNCKFYTYWIDTVIPFFSDSAAVGQLSAQQILSYSICSLPIEAQDKITNYLDTQCALIDSIISRSRASIEEYKKLKQAVITEAVTKGIRKDRQMKDSGIEWIGEIPVDWNIIKIKWLLNERKEISTTGKEEPLSMSQKYGILPTREMEHIPNMASSFVGAKIVYEGDLVFNKLKAHLGVFSVSHYNGIVSPDYAVYYAKDNANVKYLEFLFKTSQYITEFKKRSSGVGAGLTRLYTKDLYAIYCSLPPMIEQTEIIEYLNLKCAEIDKLISKKEQLISEMENFKKSLIYECVTGKREVD